MKHLVWAVGERSLSIDVETGLAFSLQFLSGDKTPERRFRTKSNLLSHLFEDKITLFSNDEEAKTFA